MSGETKAAIINGRFAVIAATIGGVCTIVGAVIGAFIGVFWNTDSKKEDTVFNVYETEEYKSLKENYDTLDYEKANLKNDNETLPAQNKDLQNQIADIPNLNQEIVSLKEEIENLNKQIKELEGNGDQPEPPGEPEPTISRVSIFDLKTFQGTAYWYDSTYYSSEYFIDTYDNSHEMAHLTYHVALDKNDTDNPVYLLDKKYSLCEGQISWSKVFKNSKNGAWIEFYSVDDLGEILLYKTEPTITATNRPLDFSFSVEGVEKLKIVTNGTNPHDHVGIIYQYLDLVK